MEDVTGARWRKSSYSNGSGSGACVEVALTFMAAEWKAFTQRVKAGRLG